MRTAGVVGVAVACLAAPLSAQAPAQDASVQLLAELTTSACRRATATASRA